jgi:hypothetical protein
MFIAMNIREEHNRTKISPLVRRADETTLRLSAMRNRRT